MHFFIKTESVSVHGYIDSLVYRALPIPADGLEIPLRLTFFCPKEYTMSLMDIYWQNIELDIYWQNERG